MAEPPAAAPAGVAVSRQDVLLATKLHVPARQPGFVPRPRLVEAVSEGLLRGLVLVCAPAGFGKTALLADWAQAGGRPVAWLGLDTGDSDPARFWRYAVAALDRALPGLADRVVPLLGPPPPGAGLAADAPAKTQPRRAPARSRSGGSHPKPGPPRRHRARWPAR